MVAVKSQEGCVQGVVLHSCPLYRAEVRGWPLHKVQYVPEEQVALLCFFGLSFFD